ncbi:hypothetical protein ACKS0A_01284 [Histoplasma ohiense]
MYTRKCVSLPMSIFNLYSSYTEKRVFMRGKGEGYSSLTQSANMTTAICFFVIFSLCAGRSSATAVVISFPPVLGVAGLSDPVSSCSRLATPVWLPFVSSIPIPAGFSQSNSFSMIGLWPACVVVGLSGV